MLKRIAAVLASLVLATAYAQDKSPPKSPHVDPDALKRIFSCLAIGLPKNWSKAWVVVTETGAHGTERNYEAEFRYSSSPSNAQGKPLHPCDARSVARDVYGLNDYLSNGQRDWNKATLTFMRQLGGFSYRLHYEYPASQSHPPTEVK